MTSISAVKLLGSLAAVLATLGVFLAAYNGKVTVAPVAETLAGVITLDGVDLPYININGRREWQGAVSVMSTSSAICVLKNPFNAPAVISDVKVNLTTNNFGAIAYDVSTSTNGFATTTTIIGQFTGQAVGTATRYDWAPIQSSTTVTTLSKSRRRHHVV